MAIGTKRSSTRFRVSAPTSSSDVPTSGAMTAAAGGKVTLGSLMKPIKDVWPVPDGTNGPLLTDPGQTITAPSTTGMTYYRWDSGKFNTQSQNWVAVPSSNGPAADAACQNVTTDRGDNYGSTGIGFPCISDFWFTAATTKMYLQYWGNPYTSGVNTSHHEVDIFVEHNGQLKSVRSMPAVYATGQATNQIFYRVVTFKEARSREFRIGMSANCWFMGVWIDTGANIFKGPNKPLLALHGNSWGEGGGNVFSTFGGNGGSAGVTWPTGCSLLRSNIAYMLGLATGFAVIICNQGGTQWINANGGITATDPTGKGFSPMLSANQVNNLVSKFGARGPIVMAPGNYNDGDNPVAAPIRDNYRNVVLGGIDRTVAGFTAIGKPTVPIILGGGEPKLAVAGSNRDLTNKGILDAGLLRPNNCLNMSEFFLDFPTSATTGDITPQLGPDGLHFRVDGCDGMSHDWAQRIAPLQVDRTWINAQMAWAA